MITRREVLMQEVVARLDQIDQAAGFNFTLGQPVQRYIHCWSGRHHEVNKVEYPPAIIVGVTGEVPTEDGAELGTWIRRLDLEVVWFFGGDQANDQDMLKALHDLEKALYMTATGPDTGLKVNATQPAWQTRQFDPETGQPLDGLVFTLSLTYRTLIGDPTQSP